MRTVRAFVAGATLLLLVSAAVPAQGASGTQTITVPLSNPNGQVTLVASLLQGGFRVEGYDGKEVVVEVTPEHGRSEPDRSGGMKRIPNTSVGLTVEEEDNVVSVRGQWNGDIDVVVIKVPRRASMKISCVNGGDIDVRGVEGELELQNTNGGISALDVSGEVVAHTTNGDVKVTFDKINPGKAMSFVTFNGDVDVTFPPGLKADLRLSTARGEILTDFDFQAKPRKPVVETQREGGRYHVKLDQDVEATIGGGGAEMHFKTWNGDIFIRKTGS